MDISNKAPGFILSYCYKDWDYLLYRFRKVGPLPDNYRYCFSGSKFCFQETNDGLWTPERFEFLHFVTEPSRAVLATRDSTKITAYELPWPWYYTKGSSMGNKSNRCNADNRARSVELLPIAVCLPKYCTQKVVNKLCAYIEAHPLMYVA